MSSSDSVMEVRFRRDTGVRGESPGTLVLARVVVISRMFSPAARCLLESLLGPLALSEAVNPTLPHPEPYLPTKPPSPPHLEYSGRRQI